jgi:hypothetical protein
LLRHRPYDHAIKELRFLADELETAGHAVWEHGGGVCAVSSGSRSTAMKKGRKGSGNRNRPAAHGAGAATWVPQLM